MERAARKRVIVGLLRLWSLKATLLLAQDGLLSSGLCLAVPFCKISKAPNGRMQEEHVKTKRPA